ncbi:relaxase/mobilization nuclease domain-containing protein [Dysgonomonas sp. Marseille-P4361]|uniref:relaxase/mobilization nuclease domain-containing protein n=1 Tax=Dysgonomonas sp. Marseille-P4361 TaxID=2161820 RepID=UPI000D54DB81|nr:relaxase/mobilization nuclease domain-containing protein [Dysgonomonas sp. Marseille-P4361]
MIAKNIKGKSFKGCINYVMDDTAELLKAEGVFADNIKNMIRSFAMQRSGRKEIKQPVGHIPMSFAPEDKPRMSNEFMLQLAKEYMNEMGIKNTQYIIVRHHSTDNEHLHIVYNRIDNDLKLISVNNDYKRNVKVCKKLKDKYKLTYGKGKERVKREKLNNPDKVKYYIYDAVKAILPTCKIPADLTFALQQFGIEVQYKHRRTTGEIEGVSFRCDNIAFKGSQIDRKFSFSNLKKTFDMNIEETKKQAREEQKAQQKVDIQTTPIKRNLIIKGVELTDEQEKILMNEGYIILRNMTRNDGEGQFSAYAFLNGEKNRVFFSSENPDTFVKYGKYEMRVRDKILLEKDYMVHAKIKWYGGGFAYPHLWNPNSTKIEGIEKITKHTLEEDSVYCLEWGDPRIPKIKKEDFKKQIVIPKIKKDKGRRM